MGMERAREYIFSLHKTVLFRLLLGSLLLVSLLDGILELLHRLSIGRLGLTRRLGLHDPRSAAADFLLGHGNSLLVIRRGHRGDGGGDALAADGMHVQLLMDAVLRVAVALRILTLARRVFMRAPLLLASVGHFTQQPTVPAQGEHSPRQPWRPRW